MILKHLLYSYRLVFKISSEQNDIQSEKHNLQDITEVE